MAADREALCGFLRTMFPATVRPLVWLAGGTVRDLLLGRQLKDIDLLAALPAARLEQLGFRPVVAKTAGSIWFRHVPSVGKVEVTSIADSAAIQADLLRRDFTVNAMLLPLEGALLDPLGGAGDLETRQLRPCSAASFSADPLRIFRAFRFVAEGFVLAGEATTLIRERTWEEALRLLPVERFSGEMLKSLAAPQPDRFFREMLAFSVGSGWLPELFRMPQIPAGPQRHHPEGDLFSHASDVLERVSAVTGSPLMRFCAFFHDLGKLATDPADYPRHVGHEEAGFRAAPLFCRRLALPTDYGKALALICRLHGKFNKIEELRPATKIGMAEQALRGGVVDMLPVIAAADKSGQDFSGLWAAAVAIARMNSRQLGIDPAGLEAMLPAQRREVILHRRVALLKSF